MEQIKHDEHCSESHRSRASEHRQSVFASHWQSCKKGWSLEFMYVILRVNQAFRSRVNVERLHAWTTTITALWATQTTHTARQHRESLEMKANADDLGIACRMIERLSIPDSQPGFAIPYFKCMQKLKNLMIALLKSQDLDWLCSRMKERKGNECRENSPDRNVRILFILVVRSGPSQGIWKLLLTFLLPLQSSHDRLYHVSFQWIHGHNRLIGTLIKQINNLYLFTLFVASNFWGHQWIRERDC